MSRFQEEGEDRQTAAIRSAVAGRSRRDDRPPAWTGLAGVPVTADLRRLAQAVLDEASALEVALEREQQAWNALEARVASLHGSSTRARGLLDLAIRHAERRAELGLRQFTWGESGRLLQDGLGAAGDGPDFYAVEAARNLLRGES